jgi:hypothetical protein
MRPNPDDHCVDLVFPEGLCEAIANPIAEYVGNRVRMGRLGRWRSEKG